MDPTKEMYMMCVDGAEWEDLEIYLFTDAEAIAFSAKSPRVRLELLRQKKNGGYVPTYMYYHKGIFYQGSNPVKMDS